MTKLSLTTASLAILGYMGVSRAQDTYYYEYLMTDASDPSAVAYSQTDLNLSSGTIDTNFIMYQVAFSGDKTWIIAGLDNNNTPTDNIGVVHEETLAYEDITTTGASISAREKHSAAASESTVYVFGGWDQTNYFNDLYAINSADYSVEDITGSGGPTARIEASLTRYGDDLIVFGGNDGAADLNDIWKFTTADGTWSELTPAAGSITERSAHCAAVLGGKLYVFGDASRSDQNLYQYDFDTDTWDALTFTPALTGMKNCSLIPAEEYDENEAVSEFLYLVHPWKWSVTKIDFAAGTSEEVQAGIQDYAEYGRSVIYEPNKFLTVSVSTNVFINDFVVDPIYEVAVEEEDEEDEEEGGLFSDPVVVAVAAAAGAAAIGAAIYFFVLKP